MDDTSSGLQSEVFSFYAGDHVMAGRRPAGLSLWRPDADWLACDLTEPALAFLPSRLWLIGLGNLGQAFAWALAVLPYGDRRDVQIVLQDFDRTVTRKLRDGNVDGPCVVYSYRPVKRGLAKARRHRGGV